MSTANERERSRTAALAEKLEGSAKELVAELLARNSHAIAHELLTASEATGGFSIGIQMALVQDKVTVDGKISWTRKFNDKEETQFRFDDPSNPALPGLDEKDGTKVTIRTGGIEVDTSLVNLKRLGRKKAEQGGE